MSARTTVKRIARHLLSTAAYYSGWCALENWRMSHNGARIFAYHSVSDNPRGPFAVRVKDFDAQMQLLSDSCHLMRVDELGSLIAQGEPIPERAVAVTIDDGFRDAYTEAFPVLRRWNIPATCFLPTTFIGRDGAQQNECRLPEMDFLTWDQVREMRQAGIDFGSHTLTHVSLTKLTLSQAQAQLKYSKDKLENELGEPVRGFSYPYGTHRDWDCQIERMVEDAGYAWAVAGISGLNHSKSDPFALHRTKVEQDDGMDVFRKALEGALDFWILIDRFGWFLQAQNR